MTQITGFDDAFALICGVEGGYSNNPQDSGGATMYGITEHVARENGYQGDMRLLPLTTAKAIAKSKYWDQFQCGQFDPRIGYLVFDAAFNGGHPVQWLQQAAGVHADGVIGPVTIGAVRDADPLAVCMRFTAYHLEYYSAIPGSYFDDGWMNRVAKNLLAAAG